MEVEMGSILGDRMGAVHPHICERGDRTHFISGTLPPLCFPAFRPPLGEDPKFEARGN